MTRGLGLLREDERMVRNVGWRQSHSSFLIETSSESKGGQEMNINRRGTLGLLGAAVALPGAAWSQATGDETENHLKEALDAGHAPGLVGLVAHGKELRTIVLGRMAIDGPPMQRDSIFRIASMTKPVTAVATMMLVADGKLKLDEPVERLLAELADRKVLRNLDGPVDDTVPAKRAITVEDLLTFRAGYGLLLVPPDTYPVQKDRQCRARGDGKAAAAAGPAGVEDVLPHPRA